MRYVDRCPCPLEWKAKAEKATKELLAAPNIKEVEIRSDIYADRQVVQALIKLFKAKCAYCEYPLRGRPEIEHFRPKGEWKGNQPHSGYPWLAYDWDNLFPSCPWCHKVTRDPTKPKSAPGDGKGAKFPLLSKYQHTRATTSSCDLNKERRALLNPCEDDPDTHIELLIDGSLGVVANSGMGEVSIETYNLNLYMINQIREREIKRLHSALKEGNTTKVDDMLADEAPFCGLLRAFKIKYEANTKKANRKSV